MPSTSCFLVLTWVYVVPLLYSPSLVPLAFIVAILPLLPDLLNRPPKCSNSDSEVIGGDVLLAIALDTVDVLPGILVDTLEVVLQLPLDMLEVVLGIPLDALAITYLGELDETVDGCLGVLVALLELLHVLPEALVDLPEALVNLPEVVFEMVGPICEMTQIPVHASDVPSQLPEVVDNLLDYQLIACGKRTLSAQSQE
ncbi:hypothetical protein FFLO_03195 [Filobasidium floriforme]|uniref:Uncharacterized protein n=1 Tax=Filobasidium floriforme TaxID=5210 RepID=A0A8K0JL46_9TREE|nr:uncharacterized protein HD553DRAFT_336539 [Filobasidium floriforme]KAG7548903.1 hypothetical protein FFLO_03195 [Filobasidium floriforme]KAH8081115.1 hypothetical protein HD553DRAFT_336539 [Filobasidium floriforme]